MTGEQYIFVMKDLLMLKLVIGFKTLYINITVSENYIKDHANFFKIKKILKKDYLQNLNKLKIKKILIINIMIKNK